jgi:hypothetical protein
MVYGRAKTVRNLCFEMVVGIYSFLGVAAGVRTDPEFPVEILCLVRRRPLQPPCFSDNQTQAPRLSIALEGYKQSLSGCRVS